MTPTMQQLGLTSLPAEARMALAQELWDSVAAEIEATPLTDAERAELQRRVALADADPSRGVPWETVRAEARKRHGR
jgi:putative addiction module component (TIGR02574 family)